MKHIIRLFMESNSTSSKIIYIISHIVLSSIIFVANFILADMIGKVTIVIIDGDKQKLINILSFMLYKCLGLLIIGTIFRYLYFKITNDMVGKIKKNTMFKILNMNIEDIEQYGQGDLSSRLMSDVNKVNSIYSVKLKKITGNIILIVGTLLVLASINIYVGIIFLLSTILGVFIEYKLNNSLENISIQIQKHMSEMSSVLIENIKGIKIISRFNINDYFFHKYERTLDKLKKANIKKASVLAKYSSLIGLIEILNVMGVFFLTLYLTFRGICTLDEAIEVFYLHMLNQEALISISKCIAEIQESYAGIHRINEILDGETEYYKEEDILTKDVDIHNVFEFKNVAFSYKSLEGANESNILHIDNLVVNKGQKIGIIGESGSGKSTISKLMLGFYKIKTGTLFVNGIDGNSLNVSTLRDNIAYIPQETYLFEITIEDNIKMGNNDISLSQVIEAAKLANAHEFITRLPDGYKTVVSANGKDMISNGERQRLGIARAILKNADIIIFDEFTSALDEANEAEILNNLKKIIENKTCIFIAHRLNTLSNTNKIVLVKDGAISHEMTYEDIMQTSKILN